MNILIISHLYPRQRLTYYGIFVAKQLKYIQQLGGQIKLISPVPKTYRIQAFFSTKLEDYYTSKGEYDSPFLIERPQYWSFPFHFQYSKLWKRFLLAVTNTGFLRDKDYTPDIVHAHFLYPDAMAAGQLKKRYPKAKFVCTVHGSDIKRYPKLYNFISPLYHKYFNCFDHFIAVSNDIRQELLKRELAPEKITTINNGFDPEMLHIDREALLAFNQAHAISDTFIKILFVGRLSKLKGIYELLEAFARLHRKHDQVELHLVGENKLGNILNKLLEEREIKSNTKVHGPIAHDDVKYFYHIADIFVLPSHSEGLPTVLAEAMAIGLPIVATDVGGIPEIITHGKNGYLVKAGDTDSLSEALNVLVSNNTIRLEMSNLNKVYAHKKFGYNSIAKKIWQIYQSKPSS
jgi:teichuronic acid biosynthesis glycosyltransferase TuaC